MTSITATPLDITPNTAVTRTTSPKSVVTDAQYRIVNTSGHVDGKRHCPATDHNTAATSPIIAATDGTTAMAIKIRSTALPK